jgi:hypothetical protein
MLPKCELSAAGEVRLEGVAVRSSTVVGVSLTGAVATINAVEIADTTAGSNFQHGGGLLTACSDVRASGLRVMNNAGFGACIEGGLVELSGARQFADQRIGRSR